MNRHGRCKRIAGYCLIAICVLITLDIPYTYANQVRPASALMKFDRDTLPALRSRARTNGKVNLIVGLDMISQPEGRLTATQVRQQRQQILERGNQLASQLRGFNAQVKRQFEFVPYVSLSADEAALEFFVRSPLVASIREDGINRLHMASSNPVIGSPAAWADGFDGTGWAVAVLDTGVEKTHPWFSTPDSKVVAEACFSTTIEGQTESFCPGGAGSSTAANSGEPCDLSFYSCGHGTHVAGTVAGNDESGPNFGVARGADVIAMQVFSKSLTEDVCGAGQAPCIASFDSDLIAAMEHVLFLSDTIDIAAVNMSLGGEQYYDQASCDSDNPAVKAAIDNLRSVDIATVASSGNSGSKDRVGYPACISSAISVGATTDSDDIASFTSVFPWLSLLAPGVSITSSVPGGGLGVKSGTSMSAPHVAGAWAVMKQKRQQDSVADILATLRDTATLLDDERVGGIELGMPRINLGLAVNAGDRIFASGFETPPPAFPDLVVFRPGVSLSAFEPDQAYTLSATVRNHGDGASDATVLRYYLSDDAVIATNDQLLGTDPIPALPPVTNSSQELETTAPGVAGTYWVGACIDPVAGESDTANQCSSGVQITVGSQQDTDGDRLWDSVETNTGIFIGPNDTGTDPLEADTDGDSIEDGDEVLGTLAGLDLPTMGVSPVHKDLLMEFDWFDDSLDCDPHTHRPTANAIAMISAAFANSPVPNPDGVNGVNLVADYGQGGALTGGNFINDADGVIAGGVFGADYLNYKAANFTANRQGYFRYVLMPHRYNTDSGSSGQAEFPGDDMIVSLYCANSDQNVAHTIMHEVGHNLYLHHGGDEACNFKPNYNSVMNYKYQFPGVDSNCTPPGNGVLDYSHGVYIDLDENNLNENDGICGPGFPWDWDGDNVIENSVPQNINAYDSEVGQCGATHTILSDFNDWDYLYFDGLSDALGTMAVPQKIIDEQPVPDEFFQ